MTLTVNDLYRMQLIAIRKVSRAQAQSYEDFHMWSRPCSEQTIRIPNKGLVYTPEPEKWHERLGSQNADKFSREGY